MKLFMSNGNGNGRELFWGINGNEIDVSEFQ